MSRKEGMIITCDRCRKFTLLEYRGDGEFERAPGGWTKISMQQISDPCKDTALISSRDLCPECSGMYVRTLNEYLGDAEVTG